jgi:catechol 2,3-dioxygenase-like lactoylglutathione lyase family enzyme
MPTKERPYGLSHINIGVTDMEASLRFYRDGLGLDMVIDQEENVERIGLRQRAVYLRWNDDLGGAFVVLDRQLGQEPFGTPPVLQQTGMNHFGFWVDDIAAILERMSDLGFDVPTPPSGDGYPGNWYGEANGSGRVLTTILSDPDGAFVQLDQWVEQPAR